MKDPDADFTTLGRFVSRNVVEPYIRHIRFPEFKNLMPSTRIDFTYPITVLVGPNGTNKSSVLRALQGSPNQYNIGDYWFQTPLDPIELEASRGPNRYIYGFRSPSGANAEVIKARVGKAGRGLDYFETSTPRLRDSMSPVPSKPHPKDVKHLNATRWRPLDKHTVYLDFRQELPAYDILMHFNWRREANRPDAKKKRIRRGAPHVKNALDRLASSATLYGANRILEAAGELDAFELEAVSRILGRRYESIRLVKHDYFGAEGYTASLKSGGRQYTEAYAGSGEFAAIMLVRAIARAPKASLILLDEPETSLHPGAQRELVRFIARACVERKHQVVIATHAPAIVAELPDEARKLFDFEPVTNRVRVVSQSASASEAFSRIGMDSEARSVVVEDDLAKAFVLKAARTKGEDFLKSISVDVASGGSGVILQRVLPVQAQLKTNCLILLDGDREPGVPLADPAGVLDSDVEKELLKITIGPDVVLRDGGDGDSTAQLISAQRGVLQWAYRHLRYLPGGVSPDELLYLLTEGDAAPSAVAAKRFWAERTRILLGKLPSESVTSREISDTQQRALATVDDEGPMILAIAGILTEALGVHER